MRSTAYGTNNSSKTITILLCLCVIAAAIWAATSDSAGSYISEKIFTPLFSSTQDITTQPSVTNTPVPNDSAQTAVNQNNVSKHLNYNAITIYAVQIGAFSSYDNAKSGAKDAIVYGGAGYIITQDGFHKLYTSAYLNEDDARAYKTSLLAQGIDACMAEIKIDGVHLDITASDAQINAISTAHETWIDASSTLFDITKRMEKSQLIANDALAEIKVMHANIQTSMVELSQYKDSSNVTQALYDNIELCDKQLSSFLASNLSDAEVSSSIKYLMMDFIYRFGQYANDISS